MKRKILLNKGYLPFGKLYDIASIFVNGYFEVNPLAWIPEALASEAALGDEPPPCRGYN
jgi:hypothetical protein